MERDTNSSRLKKSRVVGVALILIGAILLMVAYLVGWTSSNLVLLAGLALIVFGISLHIRAQKK